MSYLPDRHIDIEALRLDQARKLLQRYGSHVVDADTSAVQMLQNLIDGLCDLSQRDALTGLANRRYFASVLDREIDRVARSGEPALLLMIDIDFFKKVNDQYGHAAGDLVIKAVGQRLLRCLRPMDSVVRYGGEEFAVVLPDCPPVFAGIVAERIRYVIAAQPMTISATQSVSVTVSIGGAFAPGWVRSSPALWIERADAQLYAAKTQGRNRCCLEHGPLDRATTEGTEILRDDLGD